MSRRVRTLSLLLAGLGLHSAAAQDADTLDPITVSAPRLERDRMNTPAAVSVVGESAVRRGRQRLSLDEGLARVPGLYFQNRYNFAQGLRISSRGFGARAPFGIRGLRIRVDGLPVTLPDGQSQLDTIDLDSAVAAEVVRGPSSVLYGNATGGVIDITTADGTAMTASPVVRAEAGSHDYRKLNLRAGGGSGDWAHHVSATGLDFDGYRDHSRVRRGRLNAKVTRFLGDSRRLTGIATFLDAPTGEDPGGLTPEQAADDRRQATANAERLDAGQDVAQQRVGLVYEDTAVAGGTLRGRVHYTRRDFEQQLPFPGSSRIGYERDFYGAGASYQGTVGEGGGAARFVVGSDLDRQVDDRNRFAVDGDGDRTGRTADEEQRATAFGVFGQMDIPLGQRWTGTLGARWDRVRFAIDDRLTVDGDDTGDRRFNEVSYLAGVTYRFAPDHSLYANVATAFETPTFTEFADPDGTGGFNPELEPQQALNREVGARGSLGGSLDYDLAVYSVRVDDELVPFERAGRTFYENAGRTRRNGLELGLEWFIGDRWTLSTAYTYSDYTFRAFREDGASLRGKALPGIPRHNLYAELLWEPGLDTYAAVETQVVDSVYADNANDDRVGGYALVHLRAGRSWRPGFLPRLEVFGGVRNLFDRAYPANVRINFDAYLEPAPERTVYAGIEAAF